MTPRQLRDFRNRLGLSQAAFAKAIGVAPNTVARWERGVLGMRETTKRYLELVVANMDLTNPVWPGAPDGKSTKGDE